MITLLILAFICTGQSFAAECTTQQRLDFLNALLSKEHTECIAQRHAQNLSIETACQTITGCGRAYLYINDLMPRYCEYPQGAVDNRRDILGTVQRCLENLQGG